LVNATVAKAQIEVLARNASFARIAESIAVDIVEHTAFQPGEPVENGYFHQITTAIWRATATVAFHCYAMGSENNIQGFVPDHQLVIARWNIGNGEGAIGVARLGIHSTAHANGQVVQAHPAIGYGFSVIKREIWRTRGMQIYHLAGDGAAPREDCGVVDLVDEAYENVMTGGPNSAKYDGSFDFTQASTPFVPSMVAV